MQNQEIEKLILCKALREYGIEAQKNKTIEELSELIRALVGCKPPYGKTHQEHIAEEIADVEIMIAQLKLYYPRMARNVEEVKESKLRRLADKLGMEIIEVEG